MKKLYFLATLFVFIVNIGFTQTIKVVTVYGKEITGEVLSVSTTNVELYPYSTGVYTIIPTNEISYIDLPGKIHLTYPIKDEDIPSKYKKTQFQSGNRNDVSKTAIQVQNKSVSNETNNSKIAENDPKPKTSNSQVDNNATSPNYIGSSEQKKVKNSTQINDNSSKTINYRYYSEIYLFGGYSYLNKVNEGTLLVNGYKYPYKTIYNNGGLGGMGVSGLWIGRNRLPDVMFDVEWSLYSAQTVGTVDRPAVKVEFSGFALCADLHLSIFPIKARNKYPSPFIFAGIGGRMILMTNNDKSANAKENHIEVPFGIGLRQKITNGFALQIKERFIYSELIGLGWFFLPETRLELIFDIGRK